MHRPLRWVAAMLTAALTTTLAVAPAAAEPPESPGGSDRSDLAAAGAQALPGAAATVTLITGDVIEVASAAPDRFAASVRPAPGRESVTFHTLEVDGGMLVLPSDVMPYLSAGALDRRLFDVSQLIAQGYDDASVDELPLIVQYPTGEMTAAGTETLAAGATVDLPSIDAVAVAAGKDRLGDLWADVTADTGPRAASAQPKLAAGVAGIWLDGRVEPDLEHSVPQIGAPQVWDAGYDGTGVTVAVLDTGVDDTHPDLVGKVTDARNFTSSPGVNDAVGHGTHVAATIAGTGAASGGTRTGVAPGAEVLSGKVLNDFGFGLESWVIAGMQWAVEQDADIVNMSLGGGATDGTDPLSRAVDQLSEDSDTLFVISAGNEGAHYSVGSPGAAMSALTVGAVDSDEELATFSSRGPRKGDDAVKPEITAPGVGIVAARADGTSMGQPVDGFYTSASGTSMAAPHVAGAAALLAQAYPGRDGEALKDALVSTARPNPDLGVFAQGGGRVDALRAVGQPVYGTGVVNFGMHVRPESPESPLPAQLAYTNDGDAPVTVALAVDFHNVDGDEPAAGALTLDRDEVTVPAGETVAVPVHLDLAELARGRHAGRITATGADGVVVATTVAVSVAGPKHEVTFRAVDADGDPTGVPVLMLHGDTPRTDHWLWLPRGDELTVEVEEGTYLLQGLISDYNPQFEQATLITDPELEITGDREVLLDAGAATPVRVETPKPAEQQAVLSYYVHRVMPNDRSVSHGVMHFSTVQQVNVTPTAPVHAGEYEFSSRWQLVAPMVRAHVPGVTDPLDLHLLHRSPTFDGARSFPLVYAGTGTPDELAAAGVAGAAAVMDASDRMWEGQQIAAAADAGAAVAIIVRPPRSSPWTVWRPVGDREPIPALVAGYDGGQALLDRARADGSPRISLELTVSSPYLYDVLHVERDRVPEDIVHRVTAANSARLTVAYTDLGGFGWAKEQRFGWRPWQTYAWNDSQRFMATGTEREEWVSAGDNLWQHRVQHEYTWDNMNPLRGGLVERPRSYPAGEPGATSWHGPLVRPAAPAGAPELVSSRIGDRLALWVPELVDTAGHYGFADSFGDQVQARLWRDGEVVADMPYAWGDVSTVPEPASYRLEMSTARQSEEWRWATQTETVWEFDSARPVGDAPEPLPLLQVDYRVPTDLDGRVSGLLPHPVRLGLRHQDGLAAPVAEEVTLEVSFDEGDTWRQVPVRRIGADLVAVVAPQPGSVSLRVHAEAKDGSAVTQTVIRAYGVR